MLSTRARLHQAIAGSPLTSVVPAEVLHGVRRLPAVLQSTNEPARACTAASCGRGHLLHGIEQNRRSYNVEVRSVFPAREAATNRLLLELLPTTTTASCKGDEAPRRGSRLSLAPAYFEKLHNPPIPRAAFARAVVGDRFGTAAAFGFDALGVQPLQHQESCTALKRAIDRRWLCTSESTTSV